MNSPKLTPTPHLLSIAPMIDWTNSPFRVFMRLLAPNALLYTEMQTTGAIKFNQQRALHYTNIEHPLVLQLGGSDEHALAECARLAEMMGYDEINLNLGCPSDKVQAGRFGACLMNEPQLAARCIRAIKSAVNIPVSAKTRIGVDHSDSYEFFQQFIHQLVEAGADKIIVHARKAWLNGLNPKQNRTIPTINYDFVYQIKKEIPNIPVIINGNIKHVDEITSHLNYVDGVMLGRLACDNPYYITKVHHSLYPKIPIATRSDVFNQYLNYLLVAHTEGTALSILLKPIFNLAHGLNGASQWKQKLMFILQSKKIELFDELTDFLFEREAMVSFSDQEQS